MWTSRLSSKPTPSKNPETNICSEIRERGKAIVINDAEADATFCDLAPVALDRFLDCDLSLYCYLPRQLNLENDLLNDRRQGLARVAVTNYGPPISGKAMQNLFEPYMRGDRPSQHGLGLGLHIASEIARAHHGTLQATSTAEGTTFEFKMPLKV
jgi:signal transduction histidine kinase